MAKNRIAMLHRINTMKMTINWDDGTYVFNHNKITKSTLQNNTDCDNITREITEMFNQLQQ